VSDESKHLGFAIEDETAEIEELIAFAEKVNSDVVIGEEIATLDKEIGTPEA